jgi:hypothetical protein
VRSREEVALVLVLELVRAGRNDCEIARATGIPRGTVWDWRKGRTPDFDRVRTRTSPNSWVCAACRGDPLTLPQAPYTYLLGLYLGDGYIASHARGVYRLRIFCANAYPELIQRCEQAMGEIIATKVSRVNCQGCTEVASFSKHWPCLFPQHGHGRKHERSLIRGLLHSDGCRVLNWVNGTPYPRYHFGNVSADICGIFGRACDQLGIEWRPNNRRSLSVARRGSVALLDEFVGPKR